MTFAHAGLAICSVGKWGFGKEEWRITYKSITGTFLDEITHDIASQNWGEKEWMTEFDTMAEVGIDTVVLIRAGYRERLAYPSVVVPEHVRTLPVYEDLVDLFLRLCEPRNMRFFFGTYDSGRFWHRYEWRREVEVNRGLIREAWARYGGYEAFGGWYLSHETPDTSKRILDIHASLAEEIRGVSDLPILISPFFDGRLDSGRRRSVEEHVEQWDEYFSRLGGLIDYCAFQDGTVEMLDLEEYVEASAKLARQPRRRVLVQPGGLRSGRADEVPPDRLAEAPLQARSRPALRQQDNHLRVLPLYEPELRVAFGTHALPALPRFRRIQRNAGSNRDRDENRK